MAHNLIIKHQSMEYDDQLERLKPIPVVTNKDYLISKLHLERLLTRCQNEGDTLSIGYLLQALGDLEAKSGHTRSGHTLHCEAIDLDSNTPHPRLLYATGLLRAFNRPDLAIKQINKLRDFLNTDKWEPTANEPSRKWYLFELNALSEEIKTELSL